MSVLWLVRHGQASVHGDDYDRLSDLGHEQGRALGDFWSEHGLRLDRVFVGPRKRHLETWRAVHESLSRGAGDPDVERLPTLDEHAGPEVVAHHRSRLMPKEPEDRDERLRAYLQAYQRGTRGWVEGKLETPPGLETWSGFRQRVRAALQHLTRVPRGSTVGVFTSGGTVAALVGEALELDDRRVLELSWRIRNASLTECLSSRGAVSLISLNATPHLRDERLVTYI